MPVPWLYVVGAVCAAPLALLVCAAVWARRRPRFAEGRLAVGNNRPGKAARSKAASRMGLPGPLNGRLVNSWVASATHAGLGLGPQRANRAVVAMRALWHAVLPAASAAALDVVAINVYTETCQLAAEMPERACTPVQLLRLVLDEGVFNQAVHDATEAITSGTAPALFVASALPPCVDRSAREFLALR